MTVGEMIARHHSNDAFLRARADVEAFRATLLGGAFLRFEHALQEAVRRDAALEYQDRGEKAARISWDRSDKARAEFVSLLRRAIRLNGGENK